MIGPLFFIAQDCFHSSSLGLLLGTEAPVMTFDGVNLCVLVTDAAQSLLVLLQEGVELGGAGDGLLQGAYMQG